MKRGRKKIDNIHVYTYIKYNIHIYEFDERQCTYIVSIAPKKLSNDLKRAETSLVLIIFDCVLCEVRAYKFISL